MSEKSTKSRMSAFNVSQKSNDGVKVPLTLPDGTETDEFLVLLGADSKVFLAARAVANRDAVELSKSKDAPAAIAKKRDEINRRLVASLVVGWSFGDAPTESEVVGFFADAPQVQEMVDLFAGDRGNFFEKSRPK